MPLVYFMIFCSLALMSYWVVRKIVVVGYRLVFGSNTELASPAGILPRLPDEPHSKVWANLATWFSRFVTNPVVLGAFIVWLLLGFLSLWATGYRPIYNDLGAELPAPTRFYFLTSDLLFESAPVSILFMLILLFPLGEWLRRRRAGKVKPLFLISAYVLFIYVAGFLMIALYIPFFYIPKVIR